MPYNESIWSDESEWYDDYESYLKSISIIDPYYPCVKYKIPADPKNDGTDYFVVAESMHFQLSEPLYSWLLKSRGSRL